MELDTKTRRLRAVLDLLTDAECSTGEIMQRLKLAPEKRRSVQRDLAELIDQGEVELTSAGCYRRIKRSRELNPVQALAVYSAARMLFHHAAEYNEHYLAALEKLAQDLPLRARRVALQANEVYKARRGGRSSLVFEVAAQAWMDGKILQCTYHSQRRASKLELAIYFIEVNARNREAYAIGINRLLDDPQPYVYRLSRMQHPTLTNQEYDIPEDFHPLRFLSSAWGIMSGAATRVELFFSPAVKARVAEEYFGHHAEPPVLLGSGHTRVVLNVGNWLELVPWILGWGGEVEVIAPQELRAQVALSLRKGAGLYEAPVPA
ncbi:helix-turn-helix transcriptional regulator [Deinococcus aquaedulcis]|uniref:helix-turn-helix transcriptional regulator n=1 Tax=Deinococcus aquaedulcis TaxID=2840455 RepID=UPI001C83A5F6|nr:WYL domain-containing protein [Deinococcus aquaedulcis]